MGRLVRCIVCGQLALWTWVVANSYYAASCGGCGGDGECRRLAVFTSVYSSASSSEDEGDTSTCSPSTRFHYTPATKATRQRGGSQRRVRVRAVGLMVLAPSMASSPSGEQPSTLHMARFHFCDLGTNIVVNIYRLIISTTISRY